ncbi:MAG TPA: hypothetical protein V6C84_04125 [Coleofasciculaceae cyanobacterium]
MLQPPSSRLPDRPSPISPPKIQMNLCDKWLDDRPLIRILLSAKVAFRFFAPSSLNSPKNLWRGMK